MLRGQAHHLTHPHPAKPQRTGQREHRDVTHPQVTGVVAGGHRAPTPCLTLNTFRRIETKGKPHVTPRAVHPLPEVWAPGQPDHLLPMPTTEPSLVGCVDVPCSTAGSGLFILVTHGSPVGLLDRPPLVARMQTRPGPTKETAMTRWAVAAASTVREERAELAAVQAEMGRRDGGTEPAALLARHSGSVGVPGSAVRVAPDPAGRWRPVNCTPGSTVGRWRRSSLRWRAVRCGVAGRAFAARRPRFGGAGAVRGRRAAVRAAPDDPPGPHHDDAMTCNTPPLRSECHGGGSSRAA